ncbi:MAG: sugar phosphate isomerase/epimerase [Clostridiales bacterium]|nr:sugar phosphate isomerase/epimerase [Clostridiales bacterium]
MKIAFRTHDLGVKGAEGAVEKLHQCGIDAVQLVAYKFIDEIAYKPNALTADVAESLGKTLKEGGISVPLIGAYFNPVHSNKQKVADCKAVFKDYLKYSSLLGCNIVGSETGSFNDDKWTYNPQNRTEEALQTVIETFTELADYAKSCGAYIGMEGAAGHVCWNVATLKRAIDGVNRDNVKVIFDIYNYLDASNHESYLEILDEGLKTFAGRIVVFHLKDYVFEDGKVKQVPPGKGLFDYPAILSRIKAYDKNAVLVLEGTTGENILPSIAFIKKIWEQV